MMDDYCAKAMCATHPAVRLLEESDSDYEVEVAAFGASRLSRNNGRGGHFQHMAGGGHRPQPIMKDLVQGWVKEMVSEQKPTPLESRSNTGNSDVAA